MEEEILKEEEEVVQQEDEKIKELQDRLKEEEGKYLRLYADFQNFSKRKEKEADEIREFASKKVIQKILPVFENFERALLSYDAQGKEDDPLYQGIYMTYNNFKQVLEEEGVEIINPENEIYDPHFHEAVLAINDPEKEEGVVISVLDKGYKLKGKLVKTAKVQINKK